MQRPSEQRGTSLVEQLVAMSSGLVVVLAGLSFLVGSLAAQSTNLRHLRMNQDLRTVLDAVTRDLARAGAWTMAAEVAQASMNSDLSLEGTHGTVTARVVERGGTTPVDAFNSEHAAAALRQQKLVLLLSDGAAMTRYDLTVNEVPAAHRLIVTTPVGVTLPTRRIPAGSWTILNPFDGVVVDVPRSCVLVSYDLDGDGVQGPREHFGFRRAGARDAVQTTTTSTSCTGGSWEALTDPALLRISNFEIRPFRTARTAPTGLTVVLERFVVQVGGALVAEPAVARTLEQVVMVRNPTVE